MKKMLVILTALLIASCGSERNETYLGVREVCIDGIVYLVFDAHNKGGITAKINEDFYPHTCVDIKQ
ncbi:TPA: hypothetical protein QB352_001388 [Pasteurella multocida]|nr:hypothetical protein [Pasteurella multocida]